MLASTNPTVSTNDPLFNETASRVLRKPPSIQDLEKVDQALDWARAKPWHHIIGLDHPLYPPLLLNTNNAPPVLYVNGDLRCLTTPCIAIVGARKASHNALEQAQQIANVLAKSGITIVSGLALGVDSAAHQGALAGGGQTIAVAATGPERVYPRSHIRLANAISQHGAIVTEFPLNNSLQPHCFPRRNRIISGLCVGVLVVEAGLPSGTLTTAQHALRQGREVMAMPGSVQNPLTRGCHELIKNGAALVESAEDVLRCMHDELERQLSDFSSAVPAGQSNNNVCKLPEMTPDALTLLDCLGFDPVSIDTLVARSGLDAPRVSGALTYLEISGVIVSDYGGRYTRCKQSGILPE